MILSFLLKIGSNTISAAVLASLFTHFLTTRREQESTAKQIVATRSLFTYEMQLNLSLLKQHANSLHDLANLKEENYSRQKLVEVTVISLPQYSSQAYSSQISMLPVVFKREPELIEEIFFFYSNLSLLKGVDLPSWQPEFEIDSIPCSLVDKQAIWRAYKSEINSLVIKGENLLSKLGKTI